MPREFTPADQIAWSRFVGATYGVVIEARNFYVEDRSGYVYVASEYVATVGKDNDPDNARNFTSSINTLNHGSFKRPDWHYQACADSLDSARRGSESLSLDRAMAVADKTTASLDETDRVLANPSVRADRLTESDFDALIAEGEAADSYSCNSCGCGEYHTDDDLGRDYA